MNTVLGALVNGSIASAILAAAIVVLTSTRFWNAASRYVIWWAALLASVAIPVVYFSADAFQTAPRSASVQKQLPRATVVFQVQTDGPPPAPQGLPVFAGRGITPSLSSRLNTGSILRWVGFAWMLTSALMLVRLIASFLLLERRKAAAISMGSDLEGRLRELFRRAGLGTRSVRIAVSDEIRSPIAIGPHRPTILIPATLIQELDAFELDQVVLHEAAHLSRRDDYAVFVQRLIQALLVFHPVVHWIARRIDIEREIACDDFVVFATGKVRSYASCLTRVAELCGCITASPLAASAASSRSALVNRIEALLDDRRKASSRPMKARLVLAAAAILAVTSAGIVAPRLVAFSAAKDAVRVLELPVGPGANPTAAIGSGAFIPSRLVRAKPPNPQASTATINVQVVVTEPLHRYVSGLQKEGFKILGQGVEQSITNFYGPDRPANGSVSVCIVVNTNDRNPNELLAQATKRFQAIAVAGDELCMVDKAPQASAPISLIDLVGAARTRLGAALNPRRAIVIVSDRGPDSMEYSQEQVDALAGTYDVPIFGLTPAGGNLLLDALASKTGGYLFGLESARDAEMVPEKVLVSIRNTYVLGFQPTKTSPAGEFRQLEVQYVPVRGLPPLTFHHRAGYYTPAR
jgi:beta-lactamase regulating signal transducer with metallopeptidase domain